MLRLCLAVSRPYFWLVTLWLYLLPTGRRSDLLGTGPFWLGAAYCTLPLNLMCYLMNDLADVKVDARNARKGGGMLGAKEAIGRLQAAIPLAAALQLAFVLAFCALFGIVAWPWFAAVFAVNWLYNFGPHFSGNYAPLDLLCPLGYILVVPLSCWLNALPYPPTRSWAHAIFLVVRSQLWIQTFDIESDAAAGRRNTAVRLGLRGSQAALAGVLLCENIFVYACFSQFSLRSFSSASCAMLAANVALPSDARGTQLSPATINATFGVLGLGGVGLMLTVWSEAAFV